MAVKHSLTGLEKAGKLASARSYIWISCTGWNENGVTQDSLSNTSLCHYLIEALSQSVPVRSGREGCKELHCKWQNLPGSCAWAHGGSRGWPAKAKHRTVGRRFLEIEEMCNGLFGLACTLLYFNCNKNYFHQKCLFNPSYPSSWWKVLWNNEKFNMLNNLINLKYTSVNAIKYKQFLLHLKGVIKEIQVSQCLAQHVYMNILKSSPHHLLASLSPDFQRNLSFNLLG